MMAQLVERVFLSWMVDRCRYPHIYVWHSVSDCYFFSEALVGSEHIPV